MAREELKWQNIDADDLPAQVKKSFDAMVEAEAAFKADLEKLLKAEGHMPEDKFLVMSRKGKRLGVAFASTPRGEGGAGSRNSKPNERKQVPNPDPAILTRLDDLTTLRPATSEEIQPGASIISPSTWLAEIAQVRLGV